MRFAFILKKKKIVGYVVAKIYVFILKEKVNVLYVVGLNCVVTKGLSQIVMNVEQINVYTIIIKVIVLNVINIYFASTKGKQIFAKIVMVNFYVPIKC